jgi:hypothetical protein
MPEPIPRRTVTIPGSQNHDGWDRLTVTLDWICPACGGPRGEPHRALSFDGSKRLTVDSWNNPCGHVDLYAAVRREAATASQ